MYEQVEKKETLKRNKNLSFTVAAIICAVLIITFIVLVVWACNYPLVYKEFLSDFSRSTDYARTNDSLDITMEGLTYPAHQENITRIYFSIANVGEGRRTERPEEDPAAVLKFGDGSYMELWSVELKSTQTYGRRVGLLINYVNQDGEAITYDFDRLTLEQLAIDPEENPSKLLTILQGGDKK